MTYYIVCTQSGTILRAETCQVLPESALTEDEWEDSDNAIAEYAHERGHPVSKSEQLLNSIADILWGEEADTPWGRETLQAVADVIRAKRPDLFASRL